jgi:hypothetical protein
MTVHALSSPADVIEDVARRRGLALDPDQMTRLRLLQDAPGEGGGDAPGEVPPAQIMAAGLAVFIALGLLAYALLSMFCRPA